MKNFLMLMGVSIIAISPAITLSCHEQNSSNFQQLTANVDNNINFLATADIHAGYDNSQSPQTIKSLKKQLAQNNNRGVVISGDLTGNISNPLNIWDYYSMIKPIANHTLAGFGNHDADAEINQYLLSKIVKKDATAAANLFIIQMVVMVVPCLFMLEIDRECILCKLV